MPLINCKIELDLSWSTNCITYEVSRTLEIPANPKANPPTDHVPPSKTTGATFQIKNAKLYVSVLTLSIDESIKFSEHLKQGFRRTVSWNKYRSEITTQPKNNNLDYMIDPTFRNIKSLFVLSFKNGDDDPTRNSFDEYYMTPVEIKDFNVLIHNKLFFDQRVKNKQEVYEKLVKMSKNNDCTTGNLLDYLYHQNYHKVIDMYLSRQTNTAIPQRINFTGKLEEDDSAAMYFIIEN